jgi:hypothetical protein
MRDQPTSPAPDQPPDALLDQVAALRRRTRAQVHGAWLPLSVFALLTLASILLYKGPFFFLPASGGAYSVQASGYAGLPWTDRSAAASILFWLVAAPLCYLGCAWWYRRRAERVGLELRWQTWVWVGLGLLAVLALALVARRLGLLRFPGITAGSFPPVEVGSILSPLLAIALGLLVLARVERSWGVAVAAILYGGLATVMNLYGLGTIPPWIMPPLGGMSDALISAGPNLVLLALILLVGAAAVQLRVAVARRRTARPTPRPA